jgi:hypothetical protein
MRAKAVRRTLNYEERSNDQCIICGEFGRNHERWFRCTSCGQWVHEDCSGAESAKDYCVITVVTVDQAQTYQTASDFGDRCHEPRSRPV